MVDVSSINTAIELFGVKYPFPIAFAPSAMQKLAHPRGEESVALAAHKLGLNMTLSTQSTTSLEDVASLVPKTPGGPERWFQLYMTENPTLSIPLIQRAAGMKITKPSEWRFFDLLICARCRIHRPRDHSRHADFGQSNQ